MLSSLNRHQLLRFIMLYVLCLFAFNWFNSVLPHQLTNAPLFDISIDNTFWLFHLSGLPSWLIQQPLLLIGLECLMIALGVLIFIKERRFFTITFLLVYIVLNLLQQTYSGTLTKISVVLPIVLLPFCFSKELFSFVWKLPRYYLAYIMVSAALFKLINGGLLHGNQMTNIIANQHIDLAYFESKHICKSISGFISSNKMFGYISYILIFLVELSFLTLLFTKKFDKLFCILLVFFCVSIYLTMRINTLEILYLIFPLLPLSTKIE